MHKAYNDLYIAHRYLIRHLENYILEDRDNAGNSFQYDEDWFEGINQAHYASRSPMLCYCLGPLLSPWRNRLAKPVEEN